MGSWNERNDLILLKGRKVPVQLRRVRNARRYTLRIDAKSGQPVLTLPPRASIKEGLAFLKRHETWLLAKIDETTTSRKPFYDGARVPVLGRLRTIRHLPDARGGAWLEGDNLWVTGASEHLPRRVTDFLKSRAKAEISRLVQEKAKLVGRKPRRVSVRDTRSRWGSCNAYGDLNFCWRLIFAPQEVLDYVVAHEVAHLIELNHSARFWALTAKLTARVGACKTWLTTHGEELYAYGLELAEVETD